MELFAVLENISATIDTAGQGAASNLVDGDFSKRILMVIAGLELAWCMVLAMLESDELAEAISRIIRTLFISFLCLMAITNWSYVAADISKTSQAVVQQIGKGKELGSIVAGTLNQAMQFTKVDEVYSSTKAEEKNGGWLTQIFSDLSFGTILDKGLALVLQLGNGGVVAVVAAIAIFIIVLGKIALWVGVIFGPLCLAFAPWKPTRKIAESWASFVFASMIGYSGAS